MLKASTTKSSQRRDGKCRGRKRRRENKTEWTVEDRKGEKRGKKKKC